MKKKLLASLFVLSLILPNQAFANETDNFKDLELPAGQVDLSKLPIEFQEKLSKRSEEINDYFEKLEELKIKARLAETEMLSNKKSGSASINKFHIIEINNEIEYYENNSLAIAGLEKLNESFPNTLIQPMSTNSQATVKAPTVYYDNDMSSYVLSSGWNWSTINPDNNNGSWDGFGLRVNQEKVSVLEDHLTTFDYNGKKYSPSKTSETSAYGYYQMFDDANISRNYTAHSGTSWMFFRYYNGTPIGKTVNFNGQYAHTWSSTTLSGAAAGSSDFAGTFSVTSKGWKANNYSWKTY